jgi:hypothetical protein
LDLFVTLALEANICLLFLDIIIGGLGNFPYCLWLLFTYDVITVELI